MSSKKTIRGIRDKIPVGYVLGRSGNGGDGAVGLVRMADLATKAYVLQVAGNPPIADGDLLANTSGSTAVPIGTTLTALVDYTLAAASGAQGQILYRDSAAWKILAPGTAGYILSTGGAGANPSWIPAHVGTVTSVALALDSGLYTVTGSPVTVSGTLTGTLNTQTANTVFAGPTTGSAAKPAFRAMVSADIPSSAALAGSPTTTTQSAADNSTKIATTAFVASAVSGLGTVTTTGAPASGNLTKFSGTTSITNGDLTGAVTTSGTLATTIQSSIALPGSPTTTTQGTTDNSTKVATTAYVTTAIANAIAGVNPATSVQAATTAASNTSGFTYNNGVSGIGATFTGTVNTAVTIDGYTFTALGQRLLVKNDTQSPSGAFNGVYYVTQLQTSLLAPVLTRALDYDQPSDINSSGAIPVLNGTVNATTSWVLNTTVATVGTDPLTYTKFSIAPLSSANPSATAKDTAVNGTALTFMTSDSAPAIQKATSSQFGIVQVDGTSIIASGGTISAAGFVPAAAGAHPGFTAGNFYGPYGQTAAEGSLNMATGTLHALLFYVPVATTFTKIGLHVNTGLASSHAELGVYANNNGVPGALIQDCGQVSTAGTGDLSITGLSITLAPGWYFLALASSGTITVAANGTSLAYLFGATTMTSLTTHLTVAWPYSTGNLPNPFGSPAQSTGQAPQVWVGL